MRGLEWVFPTAALSAGLAAALAGCIAYGPCVVRECASDAKLTAEVRTLLDRSPALGTPNSVRVQTLHGIVYLRGLVSTPYQIAYAGSVATQVAGVTEVENLLSIDNSR